MTGKKWKKRGLASADQATRQRVARTGGLAPHTERGLQAASVETRRRVASAGGRAPHTERGLQAADEETRRRVAQAGGRTPRPERGTGRAKERGPEGQPLRGRPGEFHPVIFRMTQIQGRSIA